MGTIAYVFMKKYSKCPKISYTNLSSNMAKANSAYPDQTAPPDCLPLNGVF